MSVRETNVRRCRELRSQGLKLREIAAITGLSISSVSAYLVDPDGSKALARKTRGRCRDCGRPIRSDLPKRGNPKRCPSCHHAYAGERARKDMEESYRTWIAWYGNRPSALDWNLSLARLKASPVRLATIEAAHRERRWPSVFGVQQQYGSWNGFVESMGDSPITPGERLNVQAWRVHIASGQRRRRTTEREVWAAELTKRWNSGEPVSEIARALGVKRTTVYNRVATLRRYGYRLDRRRGGRRRAGQTA